jgi:glycosyltransferase involved in cell wall biosynthesis
MKIGIDISSTKVTGAGTTTYIRELLAVLGECDHSLEIETYCYSSIFSRHRKLLRKIDAIRRDIFWCNFTLPRQVKETKVDLLHCPAILAPMTCVKPVVFTVHDIYILKHPESFKFWNRELVKRFLPVILKRADRIISISEFTKSEVLEMFPGISADKIDVTPLGVNSNYRVVGEVKKSIVREKYELTKPFLLTVSTIEPRKNLANVLGAFSQISDKIDHELVLVGAYGWKCSDLFELIEELGITNRVRFLGYIDGEDLPVLYNLADIFLYPSLYEGFGLPILEAMASGCPVITSNCSSMPEVAGDAALLVDPLEQDNLAEEIIKLLSDGTLRNDLQAKGLNRVEQFTWRNCAEKTLAVYRKFA